MPKAVDPTKPHVRIEISEDGELAIEAINYRGQGCLKAVEEAHQLMGGGQIISSRNKPEINAVTTTQVQQQVTTRLS